MALTLTPGLFLFLRHAFYAVFGGFCGVTFLEGWGAVVGAGCGVAFSVLTLRLRKEIRLSYENLNKLISKNGENYKELNELSKLISTPRVLSPEMAKWFCIFCTEIIVLHFLFLYSLDRMLLQNSSLYPIVVEFVKPGAKWFFQWYDVLNDVFIASELPRIAFLETAYFSLVAFHSLVVLTAIFQQYWDAPRYYAWMKKFVLHHRIGLHKELCALAPFLVFPALAIISWADFFGATDRSKHLFVSRDHLHEIEFFSFGLNWYSVHLFFISFSTVMIINILISCFAVYWTNHQRPGAGPR